MVAVYTVVVLLCVLMAATTPSWWMRGVFLVVAGLAVYFVIRVTCRAPVDAHLSMTNERRQMMNRYDRQQRTSCDSEEQ